MADVIAIILAAGEGRRMGFPKALLPVGEGTLLDHIVSICRQAGIEKRMVVLGAKAEEVERRAHLDGERVVVNHAYRRGQTSSIKSALRTLRGEKGLKDGSQGPANFRREAAGGSGGEQGFMIFPVDLPLVRPGLVRKILTAFRGGRGMIVVPSYRKKRGHPALYDRCYRDEFLALADEEPAHHVIRSHEDRVVYVESDDDSVLFDVDGPERYREALLRLHAEGRC